MNIKYIMLLAWGVGLAIMITSWFLRDAKNKNKVLCNVFIVTGSLIAYVSFMYAVFGILLPSVG